MALVIIPGLLLWLSRGTAPAPRLAHPSEPQFWLGWLSLVLGITLAVWTSHLQLTKGQGTPGVVSVGWATEGKLFLYGSFLLAL